RPVVGIRNVVAGASGGGGPCGPEDESRELAHAVWSADAACGNRIAGLALHEDLREMREAGFERAGANRLDANGIRLRVVCIAAIHLLESALQSGFLFRWKLAVRLA